MTAFFNFRHHLDIATEDFEKSFHDEKAEAIAFCETCIIVGFAERFEQLFNLFGWHADTLIYYIENQFVIKKINAKMHFTFDCVLNSI